MSKSLSSGTLLYMPPSVNKRSIRFNMRHLLSLVRDQPMLWLVSHPHYRSTAQRQKAWFEIARCLDEEFEQLDKNEQKRIVLAIIKRWKNVRDTFFNSLRRNRTRPYIYEQELKFLLSVRSDLQRAVAVNKTEAKTNSESDGGNVSDEQYQREIKLADPLIESEDEATTDVTSDSDVATTSHKVDGRAQYFGLSAQQAASMRQDQSFFDSIKPTVRTLSEDRKFDFRIEVMRLLKRIKARRNVATD